MAVLIACEGGLQDMAAVAKHKELFKFITDATVSRPSHCCVVGAVAPRLVASRVYADVSAVTLAVRAATLAVREALFSTSWVRVVRSVVAADARLSR